ncbi:hypothetical protein [Streptomyces syringium]|uniref:hypothetical protein n=1 Tax=Streptomyces syringium TaxID=76729 RepID=UPI0037CE2663
MLRSVHAVEPGEFAGIRLVRGCQAASHVHESRELLDQGYINQSSDIGQEWVGRATNHGPLPVTIQTWVRCTNTPHTARASGPTRVAQGATGTAHAECDPGDVPTGGGGLGNPALDFNESFPTATGWTMRATNHGSIPLDLFARVTCTHP